MQIQTWIKYEESYLPPRCRKLRYRECEDYVFVTLAEAKAEELLLAFEVETCDGTMQIYACGNKLWKKAVIRDICAGGEQEHGYTTPLEALCWWNVHGSQYFYFSYQRERYGVDTSRSSVIAMAQKDMEQYLLADGILYKETTEPRYCIYTFGLGHNHASTALSADFRFNGNISKERYFSALEGEEAVQGAKRIALERGDTESVDRIHELITVHMPELVKVDPHTQHGNGNPLLKELEEIANKSPDALTAGILCMAATASKK